MMHGAHNPKVAMLRAFEQRVAEAFNAGRIRAPVHLSGGNELDVIEAFLPVRPQDWVCTSWRSHYHCLLKGVPEETLFADILAGRSITLCYPEQRVISSAIVAGIVPIAVGIAMALQRNEKFCPTCGGSGFSGHGTGYDDVCSECGGMKKTEPDPMVYCFVGDMTASTGAFHECVKYAHGWQLPIRFHVEDNGISVCTPTQDVWGPGPGIDDHKFAWADPDWRAKASARKYALEWPHSGAGKRVEF